MRKHVIRNAATLAHTIRRLILLTGGSGVLSRTVPGAGGVLAIAGSGGFAGAEGRAGVPAATVSPGFGVAALFADNSSLAGVSTETLRQTTDTLQRCERVKIIQLPAMQGSLSAEQQVFVYT